MQSLREKLDDGSRFLIATELVSVRGSMSEASAIKARSFANELVACPEIDWISITDNAGGNPQLAPLALGRPLLYAGKEVVIHLTCKDQNRNGLESEAWMLNSEGFHNILAMTGDYPVSGAGGLAKPVFDIDSVGLISLLNKMNQGLGGGAANGGQRLGKTQFCIGAVTTNFKLREGEVVPQYLKLKKKIESGAQFIISQIGFDARKTSELRCYMDAHGAKDTPLIGNVYLLSSRVAQIFHQGRIPGVVVSEPLFELSRLHGQSPDRGKAFFIEFAAKQIAICRGLGYRGAYLGGVHDFKSIESILAMERSFGPDDWKQFAREIQFSRPDEFFYYEANPGTGLADPEREAPRPQESRRHVTMVYAISKLAHNTMFEVGKPDRETRRKPLRARARSDAGTGADAGAGDARQVGSLPLQRLRGLLVARHRVSLPRIAVRQEPAQRPLRRHARGPLRSGWVWRLHLAARLRAPEARGQRTAYARPRSRDPESGTARDIGLGKSLAWPGPLGQALRCSAQGL